MISNKFDILIIGVGGQGIGILSEIIIHAIDNAGIDVRGVDTHGLAQRGGTVTSNIRLGGQSYSPLIQAHTADLIISLERHEALRALYEYAKSASSLVYYDTVWQPLLVRMRKEKQVENEYLRQKAAEQNVQLYRVYNEDLQDAKMQNIAVLREICQHQLIPGVSVSNYLTAMEDVFTPKLFEANRLIFQ